MSNQSWEQLKWGDLATLEYGKALRGYQSKKSGYPVFGTNGQIGWHDIALCDKPGIIIGRKGAYRGVHLSKRPFFVIDTAFYLKLFSDNVNFIWAYYQLINVDINKMDSGSAIPSTSREAFYQIPVLLPPLPTQHKIASILSAYDDLIENNTRRIAILEEMAQSLYQEWFVHFRYPGHEKNKMVESELGMIPEGWRVVKLEEVAAINSLNMKKGQEPETINYIDINSVSTGYINNVEPILFSEAPSRARRIVKHGDIIWSTVRPNRRSYSIIINPIDDLIVSTGFAVVSAKHVPYTYLYLAITTDSFVTYLVNHASGAAYPAVNSNDFLSAQLVLPPGDLLNSFHNLVANLLLQKHNLYQKIYVLRQTRDLLLPKLISGEIDVEELNIEIPDTIEPAAQPNISARACSGPIDATQLALSFM